MKKIQELLSEVADRVELAVQQHLPEVRQHLPQHFFDRVRDANADVITLQRRVPRSLDLTYLTSRIMVMSAPAEGLISSRADNGRDDPVQRREVIPEAFRSFPAAVSNPDPDHVAIPEIEPFQPAALHDSVTDIDESATCRDPETVQYSQQLVHGEAQPSTIVHADSRQAKSANMPIPLEASLQSQNRKVEQQDEKSQAVMDSLCCLCPDATSDPSTILSGNQSNPQEEASMMAAVLPIDTLDLAIANTARLIASLRDPVENDEASPTIQQATPDENDEASPTIQQAIAQHNTLDVNPNNLQRPLDQFETADIISSAFEPRKLQSRTQGSNHKKATTESHVTRDNSILKGNNPSTLSTFLHQQHANHFLAINLTNATANDRTLTLLRRQVANVHWKSPMLGKSETPTISHVLEVIYTIHAYLQVDSNNTIIVYCHNGKTRSAIVLACFLKFSGAVETSMAGFEYFLSRRCPSIVGAAVSQLPPSLHQFFTNFDAAVERLDYANRKPLVLRAITLQGVPVEDQPCLDVYCRNTHIYSSTPDTGQWADEEGFFRISKKMEGDFLIIVRFGGEYSSDSNDASKVLFRFCQTTGFCTSGPLELSKSKVDMMRRYVSSFEEGDFLMTLLFESYWDGSGNMEELAIDSTILVEVLDGDAAVERGLQSLTEQHAATANILDVRALQESFIGLKGCPDHLCSLALQFSNHDLERAMQLLTESKMREWWGHFDLEVEEEYMPWAFGDALPRSVTPEPMCNDVLKVLDGRVVDESQFPSPSSRKRIRATDDIPLIYETVHFPSCGDLISWLPLETELQNTSCNSADAKSRLRMKRRSTQTAEQLKKARMDPIPSDDLDRPAAMELIMQINHTGITLDDLIQLQRKARGLGLQAVEVSEKKETVEEEDNGGKEEYQDVDPDHIEEDESGKGEGLNDCGDDEIEIDGSLGPTDNARVMGLLVPESPKPLEPKVEEKKEEDVEENPPLHRDPEYQKYFKMLKVGMPVEVAKHAMQRDGKDPTIMDLDPQKSLSDQRAPVKNEEAEGSHLPEMNEEADCLPLKDDPEFAKYFKMLKMGMPVEVAKHAMKRDGKDDGIMDLDPNKSLKSQLAKSEAVGLGSGPSLEDDPEYAKYFKMLKMGLPHDAVKHSLQRDGKDPIVLEMDPKKSLASQMKGGPKSVDEGPRLKDDPDYEKYFKMLKMGLPLGAVKNALVRDNKDPAIMDLDPEKSLKSQLGGGSGDLEDDGPLLKDDEEYAKYFKMLKMGLPLGAVKNAISRDGKDPAIIDLDPERSLKSQQGGSGDELPLQDTGTPLKDDPEYSKYFKMMKMGLPLGAVKNAVSRDGKDPSMLDLDPDKSIAFQLAHKASGRSGGSTAGVRLVAKKKKKKVRRKKIYWTPIDASKLHEESLWSLVKGSVTMETLKFDVTEFETLFTESTNPAENKKQVAAGGADSKAQKKSTQVIDGKRGMNGGIILARLKIKYETIAEMVDSMNTGDFDSTQLKALKDFLPTDEDRTNLKAYLKQGEASEAAMAKAMADLSECEKYMVAMMQVKNPEAKFDAMFFKFNFKGRLEELEQGIITVKKACDEVISSERLRKMMAMILTLVNHINTGGDGTLAAGFSLDALLKLNEAKAFDKKTSVLEYLVKLVRENDMSLLDFKLDIETVPIAQNIVLDGLVADTKVLKDELQLVYETAKSEADYLAAEGRLLEMSLSELKEQRTELREIDGTAHYNKVEHKSGRTPMERFSILSQRKVDKALADLIELKDNYSKVLAYFGEDQGMPSNDFFGTLQKFILEFKTAAEKVDVIERQRVSLLDCAKLMLHTVVAHNSLLVKREVKGGGEESRCS